MITREPEYLPLSLNWLGRFGRRALFGLRATGQVTVLLGEAVLGMRHTFRPRVRREILTQMYATGIKSVGVTTVVALFTGMILAPQTGLALRDFHQEVNIGTAVMVSMLREMGPFMTGLILAACVGSAIAAQLGTMTVSEEIAALEVMSIDPVRFLVVPRLVAMIIMTPALAMYSCIMGVVGGGIVGFTQLGVSWIAYWDNATRYAEVKDLYVGLFKAVLFGVIITVVACHQGFAAKEGAVGVGMSTRKSVIVSFLLILIVGYFTTRLFYK